MKAILVSRQKLLKNSDLGLEGNVSGGGRVWYAVEEELTVQWCGWE